MMKTRYFLGALILMTGWALSATPVLAQNSGWTWQNPLPQGNILLDVSFTDTDTGTVVSSGGYIFRTTDGGETWVQQQSGTTVDLSAVFFTDATPVPVIASGGVGTLDHLVEGVTEGGASAVLAASIFHFGDFTIAQAKAHMAAAGIPVRL